jgi:hypothetical protein
MVNTLKLKDRLEGETKIFSWKERFLLLFKENDVKECVESVVVAPSDPQELEAHKNKEGKAKHVLIESMKDHLIPHIAEKENSKDMYDYFVVLYQNKNTDMMLHLKHQLQIVRIIGEDRFVSYLMNITQI